MEGSKPWYMSKGVIGGLVSLLSIIYSILFKTQISGAKQLQLVNHVFDVLPNITAILGAIISIYGRIVATKKIEGGPKS